MSIVTRYVAGQFALAFIVTALGAAKGIRLIVDYVEDGISDMAGIR